MSDFIVCCDLDGVIWRGATPIPGAAEGVAALRDAGLRVTFLTNNASVRIGEVVAQLESMGIDATPDDVGGSAQAAVALLDGTLAPGTRVLACAGGGVVEALDAAGYVVVEQPPADVVIVGMLRTFDFERLRHAADAVRAGARYIATNVDPTYPSEDGLLPGAGALVAAVSTASGREPEIAGKPFPPAAALVRERWGNNGVVVGDRPSTDGALAATLEWPFALVLSGVAGSHGEEPVPDPAPPFVAADLAALAPQLVAAYAN
jgi:glycerol-1-phosphatase